MELTELKQDQVMIVSIQGRLDTTNYMVLEKRLMELIDEGQIHLVINCKSMDYVSSSGLRILLMALKKVTSLKGRFILCALQDNIREIFEISGFTSIFDIFPDQDTALKSF
jgi:anti-anti-sigma factor